MAAGWDAEGRHDPFRELWEGDNHNDGWNFDALNEGGDDYWDAWNELPGTEHLWHDTEPMPFEPYASSSTLDGNFSPRPPRNNHHSRARSPSLEYLRSALPPIGNASSSLNNSQANHTQHPSQARSHTRPAVNNQYNIPQYLSSDFDFESYDNQNTPHDSFDGFDIDDILASDEDEDENEEDNMPTSTHRNRPTNRSPIDLTNDTSPPRDSGGNTTGPHQPATLKRPAASSATSPHPRKRRRPSVSNATSTSHSPHPKHQDAEIEEVDLTNEEELLAAQQAALIAQQTSLSEPTGPLKIGKRQCIICMEKFTDATITHCGHIYCHECLTQALLAGEKNSERGTGNCPVCRKPVSRKKANHMIVVSFMKKSAFKGKARRVVGEGYA